MWNRPSDQELKKLPKFYETENTPLEDKILYMHFFLGNCDWYIAEYCPLERAFFGYVLLNGDIQNSEWGYTSYDELIRVKVKNVYEIDRDLFWKPKKFKELDIFKRL